MKVTKVHHGKSDGVRTNCGGLVYDSPDVRFTKKWSEVICEECKKAAAQKRQRSQKRKKELARASAASGNVVIGQGARGGCPAGL
jgi:hypothetical protein